MSDVETIEEFERRWTIEFTEWSAIRDELVTRGNAMGLLVTASDITNEQRRRMAERGEVSVLDGVFVRRMLNRKFTKPK